jgi:AcrR family transcriptional regulator
MTADERRNKIVEETVRLVATHGVRGTTTVRIASAAGVTEPTLYRYFPSRRAMLLAALDRVFDAAFEVFSSSMNDDPVERLRGAYRVHSQKTLASSEEIGFQYPLFEFFIAAAHEDFRDEIRVKSLRLVSALSDAINEGKTRGLIHPYVDSTQIAWELVGVNWVEDVAHLAGLDTVITEGRTTTMLDRILSKISSEPGGRKPVAHDSRAARVVSTP